MMEEPKKKRVAERQGRKEDLENEESDENEEPVGTWKSADESILAGRKRLKARRSGTQSTASSFPRPIFSFETQNFPTVEQTAKEEGKADENGQKVTKKEEKKEEKEEKEEEEETEKKEEESSKDINKEETEKKPNEDSFSLFKSSSSSFTFSTSFSFSSSPSTSVFGVNIALPKEPSSTPLFSFNTPSEESTPPKVTSIPSEPTKTGEEDETTVFQSRSKLFILDPDNENPTWKERGIGNVKINIADDKSYARVLMRVEGSLRLILNVRLFPNLKFEKAGDKSALFTANALDKEGICSYTLRFRSGEVLEEFLTTVSKYLNFGESETDNSEKEVKVHENDAKNSEKV